MPNYSNEKEFNNFLSANGGYSKSNSDAIITHYSIAQLRLSYVLEYDCRRLVFPKYSEEYFGFYSGHEL
jgi:hypothetical protein